MARTATTRVAEPAVPRRADAGFTLTEMIVVAALIIVGTAVSIPVTTQMVNRAKNDSSTVVAYTFLDSGRDRAVAERRNVELVFVPPDKMRLERIEVPSGARTVVGEMQLEAGQEFIRFGTVPDTPDQFGTGTGAVKFTGDDPYMFTSDGSLIDSAGDVVNGTIFLGVKDRPDTARAITILGVTGMIRTWNWRGAKWLQ